MGLDIAGLDRQAITAAVGAEKGRRFYEENREWIDAHNAWVEMNGLPLARYRMF